MSRLIDTLVPNDPKALRRYFRREAEFLNIFLMYTGEHGAFGTTITELAEYSDYSKATWYNHFKSMNDLWYSTGCLNARMQREYFVAIAQSALSAEDKFTLFYITYYLHSVANPGIWQLATSYKMSIKPPMADYPSGMSELDELETQVSMIVERVRAELAPLQVDTLQTDILRGVVAGFSILSCLGSNYMWSGRRLDQENLDYLIDRIDEVVGQRHTSERMDRGALIDVARQIVTATSSDWRGLTTPDRINSQVAAPT